MSPAKRELGLKDPFGPTLLFAAVTLLGWQSLAVWPIVLEKVGLGTVGQWYFDSYAILASLDAIRAGLDPLVANPLDPLFRPHAYSDWWFALRWIGIGRADNFIVGTVWVGTFALVGWLTTRPRNYGETAWLSLVMLSPPFLLGVFRANNDLVIFSLVALCGVAASGRTWIRQVLGILALILATGLKFYAAPGVLAFLWTKPARRMPFVLAGALIVVSATLWSVLPQITRGQFRIEHGIYTMGAAAMGRELGWSDTEMAGVSVVLLALGATLLVRGKFTTGLASMESQQLRLLAALAGVVLVACFCAGISHAYRWIFTLWMALWVWRRSTWSSSALRGMMTARFACAILVCCLWIDGVYCLFANVRAVPINPEMLDALNLSMGRIGQFFHWILMTLLAGWLLEGAIVLLKEWPNRSQETDQVGDLQVVP